MKGIVLVTPKSPGTLKVTEVGTTDAYNIRVGQNLIFEKPSFPVALNDIVEFDALSGTEAKVTRVASSVAAVK